MSGRRDFRAALLDVDGTLVDSNMHHTLAWQRAFAEVGLDLPAIHLLNFAGIGGDQYVAAAAGERFDVEHGDRVRELQSEFWTEVQDWIRPLPGALELLQSLTDRGLAVVLATSAQADELEGHLATIGADRHLIHATVSSADVETSKPESEVFVAALRAANCPPRQALAVGDTVWDVRAAAGAGIPTIGLTSGGIGRDLLTGAGAAAVYDGPAELEQRLDAALLAARESHTSGVSVS